MVSDELKPGTVEKVEDVELLHRDKATGSYYAQIKFWSKEGMKEFHGSLRATD